MIKLFAFILFSTLFISCSIDNKEKESPKEKNSNAKKLTDTQLKTMGIFLASGEEPSWNIKIDFKNNIDFELPGDSKFSNPIQKIEIIKSSIILRTTTDEYDLKVSITKDLCTNNISTEFNKYIVNISINGNKFIGCGDFMKKLKMDKRLIDLWLLESINGEKIILSDLKRINPILEIRSNSNEIDTHVCCNSLIGTFKSKGNEISFDLKTKTKMACPDDTEAIFLGNLKIVNRFIITDNHLYLNKDENTLITYKKFD
ncbi:MAG: META domain-containing protein [Flavobacteriales bacterium]|nr:META domain-containing protein [Flavobacteriales bacterium]